MIRPSTGCDSAWAAVRAWYEQQKVHESSCDREVDLRLAVCIDAERARARETRRQSKGVAAEGSHPSLRTSSIVSEELGQQLNRQRSANVKEMEAYFCRGAAVEPVVEKAITFSCGGREVELARIVLKEPASEEEMGAMSKLYPNRKMFGEKRDALQVRTQSVMQKIGVKTSYLLVDASGCASAVVVRDAYSDAALRGKRVLLLLHALQGLGQGYAKVCMGSGTLCDRDIRNFVKSEAAVRAWGLPTTATPTRFLPNGPHSGRLEYEHAGGPTNQFQCGSWVERREFCTPRISSLLRRHGLVHLLPCVEQYFSETVTAYQQYAHVLLLGGRLNIMPEDLPPQLPEDLFSMLSVLFLDGGGKSRLGLHTDTEQLCPCVCSCDSLYPPGFHDFRGGELFFANGVWAEPYSRRDLVILMGHTVMHTVLPLTPSHHSPFRGCQMLRGSLVHWSHAGKELCGEMRRLLVYQSKLLSKGVALSGQYYDEWCANLRYQIRIILQHDDVNVPVPAAPSNFQCWPSVNPDVLSDLLGEAGLHLRMALSLRGGGAIRPCSKRNREA